jgi:lipid A disaccharide synthetase
MFYHATFSECPCSRNLLTFCAFHHLLLEEIFEEDDTKHYLLFVPQVREADIDFSVLPLCSSCEEIKTLAELNEFLLKKNVAHSTSSEIQEG